MSTGEELLNVHTAQCPPADTDAAPGTTEGAPEHVEVAVTSDGGVSKVILHQGQGDFPPLHAKCLGAQWHLAL